MELDRNMLQLRILILVVMSSSSIVYCIYNMEYRHYTHLNDFTCIQAVVDHVTASVIHCTWLCETTLNCKSIFFTESTSLCRGCDDKYQSNSDTRLEPSNGTLYYGACDCGDPEYELDAVISSGSTRYGSIRTYTCLWGYGVVNQAIDMTITCNEVWSPALFECIEKICPENWKRNNQSCYWMNVTTIRRTSAIEYCSSLDAHLVTMESEDENAYVKQLVVSMYGVMDAWWLGIDDITVEGNWVYTHTNELITVTDWAQGEPNSYGGNEDCAMISHNNVAWADVLCASSRRVICEKP